MSLHFSQLKDKLIHELSLVYDETECEVLAKWIFSDFTKLEFENIHYWNKSLYIQSHQIEKLNSYISRLKKHEPIQYILGYTYFDKLKIEVNENVLIPRPETEELIYRISEILNQDKHLNCGIDICTGSGCIAIALQKRHPYLKLSAIDVSSLASTQAKKNALIHACQIDWVTESIETFNPSHQFDFLVSNPPYLLKEEYDLLSQNIYFEPQLAFIEPSENYFYRVIALWATQYLRIGGKIFLEINEKNGDAVRNVFNNLPFQDIHIIKDYFGKDRFLLAQLGH